MHRAMLSLFMASSFFYTAYNSNNEAIAITFGLTGLSLLVLGIYFILRGRKQLLEEAHKQTQNTRI